MFELISQKKREEINLTGRIAEREPKKENKERQTSLHSVQDHVNRRLQLIEHEFY